MAKVFTRYIFNYTQILQKIRLQAILFGMIDDSYVWTSASFWMINVENF